MHWPLIFRCSVVLALTAWLGPMSAMSLAFEPADDTPTRELTLSPAPEPDEALANPLLPGVFDRKSGNAAVIYNKLCHWVDGQGEVAEKIADWSKMPASEIPLKEAKSRMDRFDGILEELHRAARRNHCDWELPLMETTNPFAILLPEIQEMRHLARIVAVKAKIEIAQGNYDEAIVCLQTGFAMARHVGEGELLISALVGMAISGIMTDCVVDLIEQPDSPNLYWSLTALPTPLVDIRSAVEIEREFWYLAFPEVRDIRNASYTVAQWGKLFQDMALMVFSQGDWDRDRKANLQEQLTLVGCALRFYPAAREVLLSEGYSQQAIDSMSISEAIVRQACHKYNRQRDSMMKWLTVPFWQGYKGADRAGEAIHETQLAVDAIPVAAIFLPAVVQVKLAESRTDRNITILRVIEAIRLHAASHDGRLPASLDEITEVPVPLNSQTGKPFRYWVDGDKAVLEAPIPPGTKIERYAKRYILRMR